MKIMAQRPDLLLFNPDQWRGDCLAHLGHPAAQTPNLDALAREEGISIRHAVCQNPVCTPSRCSFMSGWYPHVRGHRTMNHMLHPERGEPNLLKVLKDAGYFVWWGGKNDLVPGQTADWETYCDARYFPDGDSIEANRHNEDSWRGPPEGDNYYSFMAGRLEHSKGCHHHHDYDWAVVQAAAKFVREYKGKQPLCLFLTLLFPHPPYAVEDPFFSQIDRSKLTPRIPAPEDWSRKPRILEGIFEGQGLGGWTEDRWDELRATYLGMCARVDHQFGLLRDAFVEADRWEQTACWVFSDHGDFTGDYGLVEKTQNTFEDCLTHVPFLFKPPADIPLQPGVREVLAELVDLTATIYDLLSLDPGYTSFGRSLMPLLDDPAYPLREAVFCEGGRLREEVHCAELQSASSGNPQGLYYPRTRMQADQSLPLAHNKAVMCRTKDYKYVRRQGELDEFYDLREDPGEQTNRIDDPALAKSLAELKEHLMSWYLETADVVPYETDRR